MKISEKSNWEISDFKKSINNMIATSNTSYDSDYSYRRAKKVIQYTKEEAQEIIQGSDSNKLRNLSLTYFYSSGFYRRFILYYATLLKYIPVVIPHLYNTEKTIKDKKYSKKYYDGLEVLNNMDFEKMCQNFSVKVLSEGAYYGLLVDNGKEGISIMDLPFEYSRSRFKNSKNIDIVEFDVSYFDTISDKQKRDACIRNFPKEVRATYNGYKNRGSSKWALLPDGVGIHFALVEERPFMLNVIPAIMDFEEYREIEKEKDKQAIKKILVQEMPIYQDQFVVDPEEAEEIHRGVVGMLKQNNDVDVITSYASVDLKDMQDSRQAIVDNLEKIEKTVYSEAGVSKQLFAADGNLSLQKSIQNDLSLMMWLADSYAKWLQFFLNNKFEDKYFKFTVRILPTSYYDSEDYVSKTLQCAQYGYSFILPAVAMGINQSELVDLKTLEVDLLKLNYKLVPLQSSHTETTANPAVSPKESGSQSAKPEEELNDRTIENRNSQDNGG